jgi:hypothetical protein
VGTPLYVDCGTSDERGYLDQLATFIAALQSAGLSVTLYTELRAGTHEGVFHTQRLLKAIL